MFVETNCDLLTKPRRSDRGEHAAPTGLNDPSNGFAFYKHFGPNGTVLPRT